MTNDEWKPERLRAAIPRAREQVEIVARFCEIGPQQPNWDSHRPVVELLFYLCRLDYDIKVLLLQFLTDRENRSVWEPLLALEVHEALQTVPKAISRARMELGKPASTSGFNVKAIDEASKQYRATVKAISDDKDFMTALSLIRNGVAAHHGLSKGKGMDASVAWVLNSWRLSQTKNTPFESQIGQYAVTLALAVQDFAISVEAGNNKSAS